MFNQTLFLCLSGFIAAFVDSIAGGGGIISLPAFLAAGVPPYFALGTNKFASTAASLISSLGYARSETVDFRLIKYLAPFTLIGAICGAHIVLKIDQRLLYIMVLVLVFGVGIYSMFSKKMGRTGALPDINRNNTIYGILLAFSLGFYDGFFGPGTGSFLMFGLMALYHFDFIHASANARVLNFVSNISALVTFAIQRQVNYAIGLPVLLAMICGAALGTKMALHKGVRLVKPIFILMSLAVAGKMLLNLIK